MTDQEITEKILKLLNFAQTRLGGDAEPLSFEVIENGDEDWGILVDFEGQDGFQTWVLQTVTQ